MPRFFLGVVEGLGVVAGAAWTGLAPESGHPETRPWPPKTLDLDRLNWPDLATIGDGS